MTIDGIDYSNDPAYLMSKSQELMPLVNHRSFTAVKKIKLSGYVGKLVSRSRTMVQYGIDLTVDIPYLRNQGISILECLI